MRTITYRGEMFGETTDIGLVALRGLEDLNVGNLVADLPRYHGAIPTRAYAISRRIEVELRVRPSTRSRALLSFQPEPETEFPMTIAWLDELGVADVNERIECRVLRRAAISRDENTEWNPYVLIIELVASDPAIYEDTLNIVTVLPFVPSAGLSYPVTYPKAYGAGGSGSGTVLVNAGVWETWPTLKINGPSSGTLTNPIVENVTTGKTIELNANGGVSIGVGQQLIVETHPVKRSILFSTGASRYGRQSNASEFWPLVSGNNELRFRATGTTTGATLVVEWRSARI